MSRKNDFYYEGAKEEKDLSVPRLWRDRFVVVKVRLYLCLALGKNLESFLFLFLF